MGKKGDQSLSAWSPVLALSPVGSFVGQVCRLFYLFATVCRSVCRSGGSLSLELPTLGSVSPSLGVGQGRGKVLFLSSVPVTVSPGLAGVACSGWSSFLFAWELGGVLHHWLSVPVQCRP